MSVVDVDRVLLEPYNDIRWDEDAIIFVSRKWKGVSVDDPTHMVRVFNRLEVPGNIGHWVRSRVVPLSQTQETTGRGA